MMLLRAYIVAVAAAAAASGCLSTTYSVRAPSDALPACTRRCEMSLTEHYFFFGLVARDKDRDFAALCRLAPGESFARLDVVNEQSALDGTGVTLGAMLTFGLVNPVIWTTRTTTVAADVATTACEQQASERAGQPAVDAH